MQPSPARPASPAPPATSAPDRVAVRALIVRLVKERNAARSERDHLRESLRGLRSYCSEAAERFGSGHANAIVRSIDAALTEPPR